MKEKTCQDDSAKAASLKGLPPYFWLKAVFVASGNLRLPRQRLSGPSGEKVQRVIAEEDPLAPERLHVL